MKEPLVPNAGVEPTVFACRKTRYKCNALATMLIRLQIVVEGGVFPHAVDILWT